MEKMYYVLKEIYKNPVYYLGCISLDRLFCFVINYKQGKNDRIIENTGNDKTLIDLKEFDAYVKSYYHFNCMSLAWGRIINFYSDSDERGFYQFYELLEKFLFKKNKKEDMILPKNLKVEKINENIRINALLQNIRKRPKLYLGDDSLGLLYACLSAECTLLREEGTLIDWSEFQRFIEKTDHISTGQNWEKIMQLFSPSDEYALNRFFELYDEFLKLNIIT